MGEARMSRGLPAAPSSFAGHNLHFLIQHTGYRHHLQRSSTHSGWEPDYSNVGEMTAGPAISYLPPRGSPCAPPHFTPGAGQVEQPRRGGLLTAEGAQKQKAQAVLWRRGARGGRARVLSPRGKTCLRFPLSSPTTGRPPAQGLR